MSARMRIGWGVVALAWGVGTGAPADSISGGGQFPGGMSAANLSTFVPSWDGSALFKAPPAAAPAPSPPAAVLPPPDAYSSPAPAPFVPPASPPAPVVSPAAPSAPDPTLASAPAPVAVPGGPVYILPASYTTSPAPAPTPVVAPAPAPAPVVAPAPASVAVPGGPVYILPASDTSAVAPASVPAAHPVTANAFINMGTGPYPEANLITNGNAQPWYNSPQIVGLFGAQPGAQQQADFTAAVMQRVQQTFQNSGVAVSVTSDPSVPAVHTLSLVSNTAAKILPAAIGMTDIGVNGFSFIDQEAKSAGTLDQLEWIVAHNLSHELMLAFGVGEKYDASGHFIDARNATLSMMLDPKAAFSSAAADALNQALAPDTTTVTAAQALGAQTVAEPGTLAVWGFAVVAVALRLSAKARNRDGT